MSLWVHFKRRELSAVVRAEELAAVANWAVPVRLRTWKQKCAEINARVAERKRVKAL